MQTEDVAQNKTIHYMSFADSPQPQASEVSNRSIKKSSNSKRRWFIPESPQTSNADKNLLNTINQYNDCETKEFEELGDEDIMYSDFHTDYAENFL